MNDFWKAGLVYATAFLLGQFATNYFGFDGFVCGWFAAAIAVYVRWTVRGLRNGFQEKLLQQVQYAETSLNHFDSSHISEYWIRFPPPEGGPRL